jgi:methylglutaconyl-CoA hydratase
MKDYNTILIEVSEQVATVWLNRPELHNAVSPEMLDELMHCFSSLEDDKNIRVILLRGKGKSFSAGADLVSMLESNKLSFEKNFEDGLRWANCLSKIYNCTKPTIGVATGNVFGGGNGLLCATDIVVAENNAVFSFSEVKLGIAPSTILPYVLTRLNEHKAKYLMFTGNKVNATEAKDLNLVDFVINIDELNTFLTSLTKDLLRAAPGGIKEIKFLISEIKNNLPINQLNELTASSIARLKKSQEAYEGISSFIEKRTPNWNNC